jgi:hypothetical protein
MFFAQCEVAIALDAHDKWLKYTLSGMAGWESTDNSTYRGVYVLGFLSSISYLFFAIVMIVCMKAGDEGQLGAIHRVQGQVRGVQREGSATRPKGPRVEKLDELFMPLTFYAT